MENYNRKEIIGNKPNRRHRRARQMDLLNKTKVSVRLINASHYEDYDNCEERREEMIRLMNQDYDKKILPKGRIKRCRYIDASHGQIGYYYIKYNHRPRQIKVDSISEVYTLYKRNGDCKKKVACLAWILIREEAPVSAAVAGARV